MRFVRGYSTASFEGVFAKIDEKLQPSRINTTMRQLVYRPRRQRELRSLKRPIVIDGEEVRKSKLWAGQPSAADLTNAIKLMESEGDFGVVKGLVKEYAQYYPGLLRANHANALIRRASELGLYNHAITLLRSTDLYQVVPKRLYLKEQVRMHAVRIGLFGKTNKHLDNFLKLFSRQTADDVQFALLRLVGVFNFSTTLPNGPLKPVDEHIEKALQGIEAELGKIASPKEFVDGKKKSELAILYTDLTLGLEAVRAQNVRSIDTAKLEALLNEVSGRFKTTTFSDELIERLRDGFAKEQTIGGGASAAPAASEAAETSA
ncbi:hypothetical protein TRVA0_009S00276 [Trichomonascus vanleenenianus]|uniref:uncharacterized protein n=1 Tax=Trichomonascus vanleenenianus TaxID=2268995 RepID=UPI003ECB5CBD